MPYSFEPIRQKSITRDSDAKYKTKTDAIHVCNRKTAQTGRKKSRAFAQLFKNLLEQIYVCVLHAKLVCTLVGAYCNVDFVALDRSAGVLSDEHAVALDEYAAAERNDGRINCDRAAFGQGGAGSGQCQIVAVAFNARIVEGQFVIAKRSGICLDGIACQIRCGVSYRTGSGCTCDQLVVSGLGCSGLDLSFLLSCFFSGLLAASALAFLAASSCAFLAASCCALSAEAFAFAIACCALEISAEVSTVPTEWFRVEESTAVGCSSAAAPKVAIEPTVKVAARNMAACLRREIDICVTLLKVR